MTRFIMENIFVIIAVWFIQSVYRFGWNKTIDRIQHGNNSTHQICIGG